LLELRHQRSRLTVVRTLFRIALQLATVGALAAWLAPYASNVWWLLELPGHFRVQNAIALILLASALALARKPRWVVVVLGALAIGGWPLLDFWPRPTATAAAVAAPPSTDGTATRPVRLKLMTANVWYRDLPAEPLIEIVRAEQPDVIFLQEYTRRWARRLAPLDETYPYAVKRPAGGSYGIAILSRHPLRGSTYRLGRTPAITARLEVEGRTLALIGVHLRAPTTSIGAYQRNQQLDLLAAQRATIDGPLVIAGDFNNTTFVPSLRRWLATTGLKDPRQQHGLSISWPTFLPILGVPIDHLFVSDEITVTDHRRAPAFGSDHFPVIAEIELP
jgi:endonuclease/exonuclease/phosphatase (EEP) superfamily protein YafD